MKICILIDDYLPASTKIAAKMMHELAVEFVRNSHQVIVITPSTEIYTSYKLDVIDGVQVYRFKSGRIKNVSKIVRAINESLLPIRAWIALRKTFNTNPQDFLIYYSPTIFWGGVVKKLKKI